MHPYRDSQAMNTSKKLPRFKARCLGLYRRVILPTKIVCLIGFGVWFAGSWSFGCERDMIEKDQRDIAAKQKHNSEMEIAIGNRQGRMDQQEKDFAQRVQTFEDMTRLAGVMLQKGEVDEVNKRMSALTKR
jgi:hypothetical protein